MTIIKNAKIYIAGHRGMVGSASVESLLGDATKDREKLGWTPKIKFDELVAEMVREDIKFSRTQRTGYTPWLQDYGTSRMSTVTPAPTFRIVCTPAIVTVVTNPPTNLSKV